MPEIKLTVNNKMGLHARPAALFAQAARQFACDIWVTYDAREANAKSVLSMLTLGVEQGAIITIQADGEDADRALTALGELVEHDLMEGE